MVIVVVRLFILIRVLVELDCVTSTVLVEGAVMRELNYPIAQFISAEVTRQGHVVPVDHILRCMWMGQAWQRALDIENESGSPAGINATVIMQLGHLVERCNAGWRWGDVRVGNWHAPTADMIDRLMKHWGEAVRGGHFTPDEAYKAFEEIHPFLDGNGRVGKIIHNWMNGTLLNPVLVQDFFGHGVP